MVCVGSFCHVQLLFGSVSASIFGPVSLAYCPRHSPGPGLLITTPEMCFLVSPLSKYP